MVLTLLLIDFKRFLFSDPWVRDDPIATGQIKTYHLWYLSKKEYFSINFSVFHHEKNNFEKQFKLDVYFRQLSKVTNNLLACNKVGGT